MNFQLVVKPTATDVAATVCDWLMDTIAITIERHGRCTVALSGGSTPKRLYERIAERELDRVDWSKVILLWGDERNVPPDHEESNYRMVRQAWLDRAAATHRPSSLPQVYPVPVPSNAPDHAAFEYSQTLHRLLSPPSPPSDTAADSVPRSSGAVPSIDIVLLGLGDDAHTASIFPDTNATQPSDAWFVANYVPKLATYRLTMTAGLINAAHHVAFIACGESKQPAIELVWHGPRLPNLYPAQLIQPTHGQLFWFLDAAAQPYKHSA